jgi:ApaG protein
MLEAMNHDVKVQAVSFYLPQHSEPSTNRYSFGYNITIINQSNISVQLLDRHWLITDGIGRKQEVKGVGVVGQQPVIQPGEKYEYSSFCPLTTPYGYMEGTYGMTDEQGNQFRTEIPMFILGEPTSRSLN